MMETGLRGRRRGALLCWPVVVVAVLLGPAHAQLQQDSESLAAELETATGKRRIEVLHALARAGRREDPRQAITYWSEALELISKHPDPKLEVDVLNRMAWAHIVLGELDRAIEIIGQSHEKATIAGYDNGLGNALNHLGVAHWYKGEYHRAVEYHQKALTVRESTGNRVAVAGTLNNIGIVQRHLGSLDLSLDSYLRSLRIKEELDDTTGIANTTHNIAEIYRALDNHELALEYYQRSMRHHRQIDNKLGVAATLNAIGRIQAEQGDSQSALASFDRSYALAAEVPAKNPMARALFSKGKELDKQGRTEEARQCLTRCLELSEETGVRSGVATASLALAKLSRASGHYQQAVREVERVLAIASEMEKKELVVSAYEELAELHAAMGEHQKAFEYHKSFTRVRDEIFSDEHSQRIERLQRGYEAEKRASEIALLKVENRLKATEVDRQRFLRNLSFAGAAIALLLVILLYRRYRERKLLADELEDKKEQLEKTNVMVSAINSEVVFDDLLREILHQAQVIKGAEKAGFLVRDRATQRFRVRVASGWEGRHLGGLELTFDEVRQRYLRASDEIHPGIFVISDVAGRSAEDKIAAHLDLPKSMIVMAVEVEDRLEGLLVLDNHSGDNVFAERDTDLLRRLKEHVRSAFIKTRLLSELKDLNDKSKEVLRIAAHDFRSPYASMMGSLQLIRARLTKGSLDVHRTLEHIDEQLAVGRATIELLERLLDLSAIESGNWELHPGAVNVTQIVRESEVQHRATAAGKEIEITFDLRPGIPEIEADPARLRQVLDNLISNAIKYTFPGGKVEVVCRAVNGRVLTSIKDTGQGLSAEDMEQVFRSFKKLSARPTGGESSTGIGLAIAKSVVEMHGGRIWVESEEGEGATFTFSLPISRP